MLQKEKEAAAAAEAASRKSSRPGKGRNPRLEREDEQIEIPKKVSHKRQGRAVCNPKKGQSHKLCFPKSGPEFSIQAQFGSVDPVPNPGRKKMTHKKGRCGEIAWLELVNVLFRGLAVFLEGTLISFFDHQNTWSRILVTSAADLGCLSPRSRFDRIPDPHQRV